ncbi:hypothetical protein DRN62_03040 [Nanoarchaeota archaeon]|nr:MAG: hypothetical protein DRN62_03040 [Nanoarchaeota archaeon]
MWERLFLRTEGVDEKKSACLAGVLSVLFFFLSVFLPSTTSYVLKLGSILYATYALYFLKEISGEKSSRAILLLASVMALVLISFLWKEEVEGGWFPALLSLFVIYLPVIFWEELLELFGRKLGVLLLLFLFLPGFSQNETNQSKIEHIKGTLDLIQELLSVVEQVLSAFSGLKEAIRSVLGLSPEYATVVNIILILSIIYLFMKALKWFVKWAIIIVIMWVILQLLGFL